MTTGRSNNKRSKRLIGPQKLRQDGQRRGGGSGFTLLELVFVMVIMGTLLAMAGPSLRGFFASREVNDAAASIVALTQLARSQAVAEGRVYRLNFDAEEMTYWLTAQSGGAFQNLASEFGRIFALPEGAGFELSIKGTDGERSYLSFHPSGRTEAAEIRLRGKGEETVGISCLSPTEFFRVEPVSDGSKE